MQHYIAQHTRSVIADICMQREKLMNGSVACVVLQPTMMNIPILQLPLTTIFFLSGVSLSDLVDAPLLTLFHHYPKKQQLNQDFPLVGDRAEGKVFMAGWSAGRNHSPLKVSTPDSCGYAHSSATC